MRVPENSRDVWPSREPVLGLRTARRRFLSALRLYVTLSFTNCVLLASAAVLTFDPPDRKFFAEDPQGGLHRVVPVGAHQARTALRASRG